MDTVEKKKLLSEAKLQMKALNTIRLWRTIAIAFSSIGVALTYAGFAGESRLLFLGIPGIILIIAGVLSAAVLNLGLRNGRRNVEKILNIVDQKNV